MKVGRPPSKAVAAYRLLLEYDGSRYHGWQRQGATQSAQGIKTVAGSLERVLNEAGVPLLSLVGSGRTDAGVHALGQVAHLHLPQARRMAPKQLWDILQGALPQDIVVRHLEACTPEFHARHSARNRTYLYQLSLRRSAFAKPYIWWVKRPLDLGRLESAWGTFEGTQDMTAFADLEPGESPRVHLTRCTLTREGSLILLRATGSHFLRKQMRRMVGASVAVGLGAEILDTLCQDLTGPRPDSHLRWSDKAAPSAGLFLEHVAYGESESFSGGSSVTRVP